MSKNHILMSNSGAKVVLPAPLGPAIIMTFFIGLAFQWKEPIIRRSIFGGASRIRTADLWIMIPSL